MRNCRTSAYVARGVVEDDVQDHGEPVVVTDVDERLELVDADGEHLLGERRLAALREQAVRQPEVTIDLRVLDLIVHLGREQVRAVVAHAAGGAVLDDGQRFDGIHAEVCQVLDPIEHVQELGHALAAVGPEPGADVELVHDRVAKRGRPPGPVLPWERRGRTDDAGGIGPLVRQLAGVGIALEPLVSRADDEELVSVAIGGTGDEPGPASIVVADEA
jgi:hypothetical protein